MVYLLTYQTTSLQSAGWREKMKRQVELNGKSKKVVTLRLDAGFFFERAVKMLDRRQYDKALKYFRLASEKEPDNPVNHCNLAGLLSEMGNYQESNEILEMVLREIDPSMVECLFYMANNAANMDEFELAEDYLLEYLGRAPEGEYVEEAEDLLTMISHELGRPPREVIPYFPEEHVQRHEVARQHLEDGRFLQATEILKELVEEYPSFLPARNNLALAYYYMGQMDLSLQTILQVLEVEENNLHALCNLAVLSSHMGRKEEYYKIIDMLRKLIPLQKDQTYKLATTMGILGEHEVAYQLFSRIARLGEAPDASLYHATAVAAFRSKRLDKARYYWQKAKNLDPSSEVPAFYLNLLDQENVEQTHVSYQFQLPFEEQLVRADVDSRQQLEEKLKGSPLVRSSLLWALENGELESKFQVIQTLGLMGDSESEQVLRMFLLKPDQPDILKEVALLQLRLMGADAPIEAHLQGKYVSLNPEDEVVETKENQILAHCLENLAEYDDHVHQAIESWWREWLKQPGCAEQVEQARKVEVWSAGLAYWMLKQMGIPTSQAKIAERFGVSASAVARISRELADMDHPTN